MLRSRVSVRVIAVGNGSDSAVIEVWRPQTAVASSAGKSRHTDRVRVGRRTARWNQLPQCSSRTVYSYSIHVDSLG
jgi:hypothetical protein